MKYQINPNCNNCDSICKGAIGTRHGKPYGWNEVEKCRRYTEPKKWKPMLAELALTHPQSLHDSLSVLPFKVKLNFTLN